MVLTLHTVIENELLKIRNRWNVGKMGLGAYYFRDSEQPGPCLVGWLVR